MIQQGENIVPLAEDEVAKLIDQHVDLSWPTDKAKFILPISHEDLEEAITDTNPRRKVAQEWVDEGGPNTQDQVMKNAVTKRTSFLLRT